MKTYYKWDNPYEWLRSKVQEWNWNELKVEFLELAAITDFDTLQDLYQSDMEIDGYFEKKTN